MVTTRSTILRRAFGRIGIADYEYDVSPDEQALARTMLDAMMAEWEASGVNLDYVASAPDDNDGVAMTTPVWADAAIWNNLAVRLAPDFGKMSLADLRRDAKRGYDLCVAKTMIIPRDTRATARLRGGGDRYYRSSI